VFLQGLLLGFSIAAPVGPIGLLCIQRTLARGRLHGFVSGLGAASADSLYGIVAALGLTAMRSFLLGWQFWLQLGGGVFLVCLGGRTLLARPATSARGPADDRGLGAAYLSILLLTLANPATVLAFFAVFAGLGISPAGTPAAILLVAGVFLGSAAWWLVLSLIAGLLRRHLTDGRMRLVNIIAGSSILALGLWSLVPLFRS
jgi:threonine/homoserine/homoserine lactone efflux protein